MKQKSHLKYWLLRVDRSVLVGLVFPYCTGFSAFT